MKQSIQNGFSSVTYCFSLFRALLLLGFKTCSLYYFVNAAMCLSWSLFFHSLRFFLCCFHFRFCCFLSLTHSPLTLCIYFSKFRLLFMRLFDCWFVHALLYISISFALVFFVFAHIFCFDSTKFSGLCGHRRVRQCLYAHISLLLIFIIINPTNNMVYQIDFFVLLSFCQPFC